MYFPFVENSLYVNVAVPFSQRQPTVSRLPPHCFAQIILPSWLSNILGFNGQGGLILVGYCPRPISTYVEQNACNHWRIQWDNRHRPPNEYWWKYIEVPDFLNPMEYLSFWFNMNRLYYWIVRIDSGEYILADRCRLYGDLRVEGNLSGCVYIEM